MKSYDYPIVVIGAGSGGLVVALGAARAGKRVLLIDAGKWGGDCTNFGCIPSKALIAAAHSAHHVRRASSMGISLSNLTFDTDGALDRVRAIVSEVRSHEEPEALHAKGVATLVGWARFVDPHTLEIEESNGTHQTVTGRHIVLATGSHPIVPKIDGLSEVPYLTNETVFSLKHIPDHLLIVGGGPIGCELAQAFRRLGSCVSLIQRRTYLLAKEEPEAQAAIAATLEQEGVHLSLGAEPITVRAQGADIILETEAETARGSHLLVAASRRPTLTPLQLEQAGVEHTDMGIAIDRYGRTNQKHIWAIGDVVGGPFFTHRAENHGRTVLTSLLAPFNKKLSRQPMPRCTYTDPEVAAIGLLQNEALAQYGKGVATYTVPLSAVDRAITAGETTGLIKVVTRKSSSQILGATIVAPRAGEMLGELSLAMLNKIPLRHISRLIHSYPTYSSGIRQAADKWLTETVLGALKRGN